MNHLAFHVPAEKFDAYRQRFKDKGVRLARSLNHDESAVQVSATVHPGVYVRSFYFQDPDGITLEFACWVKEFTEADTGPTEDRGGPPPAAAAASRSSADGPASSSRRLQQRTATCPPGALRLALPSPGSGIFSTRRESRVSPRSCSTSWSGSGRLRLRAMR